MSRCEDIEARLRRVEEELSTARAQARRRARIAWGTVAAACVLGAAGALADPSSALPCNAARSSSFFCFGADAPARADSVNHNFEFLARWVEAKVGPANPANAESAPTGSGGLVLVGNPAAGHLALDGDEVNARNGGSAASLYLQEGAGAGDTALNSASGRVVIGGAGPNASAKLGVNGLAAVGSLQVGSGGTTFTRISTGVIGNCASAGSAGATGSVTFPTAFASTPVVFLSVEELDQTGCTSARTTARSNTGFSFQAWVGGTSSVCDCIHWIAIGQ